MEIPDEWKTDHFVILNLSSQPKSQQFITSLGMPDSIRDGLYILSIPKTIMKRFRMEFKLIESHENQPLPFSFDDFILAYLGAMNGWGIVSLDKDLHNRIDAYLSYDSYLPSECSHLPADSIVLLDTNILYKYVDGTPAQKQEISLMISENPHLTFLISDNILAEIHRVAKKEGWTKQDEIDLYLESEEGKLVEFIDDFEGFQSENLTRRKRKKKNRQKHYKYKDRYQGKWGRFTK